MCKKDHFGGFILVLDSSVEYNGDHCLHIHAQRLYYNVILERIFT